MERKRILVIDDCRLTLAIARDMLEAAGFEVLTAESGIQANSYIFAQNRPDLLLVDIELPMLSGDRKVKLLKSSSTTRDIPILLISHKSCEELERLAAESGAEGWIAKPLRPETLLDAIRPFLSPAEPTEQFIYSSKS